MKKNTVKKEETKLKQYISFSLDDESYGLDIMFAESIERIMDITAVPRTMDFVTGVTNIRGEIIPVISLRKRLGLKIKEYNEDNRIIVCEFQGHRLGVVVDKVNDVFSVPESNIQIAKEIFKEDTKEFFTLVIKLDKSYVLVLDLQKVFNLGE